MLFARSVGISPRGEFALGGGMRVIARLLVALAVAFPVSVAVTAGIAHGDANTGSGPAVLKCMHWKGSMAIAPGISDNPGDQNVSAHGKLYGCNKAGGGAQYTASLVMTQATCANLEMSGVAQFEWANGQHSTAFLAYHPQANEPKKQYVNGSITSGAFQGLIVSAWVRFTEVFNGSGVNCSSGNQLKQIKFSNTQSFQLLTPNIDTTTTSPHHDAEHPAANGSGDEPGHGSGNQPGNADDEAGDRHHHPSGSRPSGRDPAAIPHGDARVHGQQQCRRARRARSDDHRRRTRVARSRAQAASRFPDGSAAPEVVPESDAAGVGDFPRTASRAVAPG